MWPSFPELMLILIIMFLIFGMGKLPSIGDAIGKIRSGYRRGLTGGYVDITPDQKSDTSQSASEPKPGTRQQPVEDAQIVNPEHSEEPSDDDQPESRS